LTPSRKTWAARWWRREASFSACGRRRARAADERRSPRVFERARRAQRGRDVSAAFVIRDLRAEDRASWNPLWAGYLEFYEARLPEDVSDLTFARLLDPGEPMFALVAESAGELVGLVHCVMHRATWSKTHHCYLEDLFVAPDARDQRIGRALIEAVYARADALGATRTYWLTLETNATARILYESVAKRSGFIQYRRP
jgi:GNAT superfamily N-acetyltransferase